ncbi:hypothetical protein GXB81_28200 [Paraburkholderia sp. Ac-20336]|uniref:hypothetical protein n=1 Tax=unclassified Paraburkholderia TaxID=2615204 RepID=UPI0014203FB9|nr:MULTISPECIES: hypothetical protein [unclassified Paraburkholderia]MBN3806901.1 hypothetical protein [Paraburkholderia sp. Ac-20336]MBN3849235.1 hypothetical protein [Paraburkholderia sp. Ac-20342]NIF79891.1 hypothetical protein [Paraburkholderia sp. Cy-641]
MKKTLICITLALVMTLPVAIGIIRIPGMDEWFSSGADYDFFEPLFKALGSDGNESNSDIVFATMLITSFFLSLALIIACWAIVSHLHRAYRR